MPSRAWLSELGTVAAELAGALGVAEKPDRIGPLAGSLQRLTARLGGDRSAMMVRVFGMAEGKRVERRWLSVMLAKTLPYPIRSIAA